MNKSFSKVLGKIVVEISFMDFSPAVVTNVELFDRETREYLPFFNRYRTDEKFRLECDEAVKHHQILMDELRSEREEEEERYDVKDSDLELMNNSYSENDC